MRLGDAIDAYMRDMRAEGRIRSDATERSYRDCLHLHADDVANRDPRTTTRNDVKRTLGRWQNPNTRRVRRACLVSFYDWAMQELEPPRKDNPARQTRPPRATKPNIYRLTRSEAAGFMHAARSTREQRIAYLGIGAGVRLKEFRGLQGRHFARPGWIWVSPDIGKGGRGRWIPVLVDLLAIAEEIRASVAADEYVIPAERWRDPGRNTQRVELAKQPASRQVFRTVVSELAQRAGIAAHIHPHVMRHAFADHVARYAGVRNAQFLLGHADLGTTEAYLGEPTLDDLADAVRGISFLESGERPFPPNPGPPETPLKAPTRIELVQPAPRALKPSEEAP